LGKSLYVKVNIRKRGAGFDLIHFVFQVKAVNFQPQAFGTLKTGKVTGFGDGFGQRNLI
jgi:hypothetical protein